MIKSLSFLGATALLALVGCSHDSREANTPATSPTSDTMQSQTNDDLVPYRFPMTDGTPRPEGRTPDNGTDTSLHDFPDLTPVGRPPNPYRDRSGFPAPNSSNPPEPGENPTMP
jgi:hypothetical protein